MDLDRILLSDTDRAALSARMDTDYYELIRSAATQAAIAQKAEELQHYNERCWAYMRWCRRHGHAYDETLTPRQWWTPWREDRACTRCGIPESAAWPVK